MIIKLTDRYGVAVRVNFDNVLYYQPNSNYKTFNSSIKMLDKTTLDVKETVEEIDKLVGIYEENTVVEETKEELEPNNHRKGLTKFIIRQAPISLYNTKQLLFDGIPDIMADNSEDAIKIVKEYFRKKVDNLNDFFKHDNILIVCIKDVYGNQYQYMINRDEVENRVKLRK